MLATKSQFEDIYDGLRTEVSGVQDRTVLGASLSATILNSRAIIKEKLRYRSLLLSYLVAICTLSLGGGIGTSDYVCS